MHSTIICFFELLKRELYVFCKNLGARLFDMSIIFTTNLIVFGYFLPKLGQASNYGQKILFTGIIIFGLFEIIGKVANLIGDITSDRLIANFLILPLPPNLVFLSIALGWAIESMMVTMPLFVVGNLIFLNKINYEHFNILQYVLLFISANLFYGFFSFWIVSIVPSLRNIGILWCRIINPMFMFGGFFYSWQTVYNFAPWFGIIEFINPLIYITEGSRAAALGPEGSLNFWMCFALIWTFTTVFCVDGIRRMKKRLDCL